MCNYFDDVWVTVTGLSQSYWHLEHREKKKEMSSTRGQLELLGYRRQGAGADMGRPVTAQVVKKRCFWINIYSSCCERTTNKVTSMCMCVLFYI